MTLGKYVLNFHNLPLVPSPLSVTASLNITTVAPFQVFIHLLLDIYT